MKEFEKMLLETDWGLEVERQQVISNEHEDENGNPTTEEGIRSILNEFVKYEVIDRSVLLSEEVYERLVIHPAVVTDKESFRLAWMAYYYLSTLYTRSVLLMNDMEDNP